MWEDGGGVKRHAERGKQGAGKRQKKMDRANQTAFSSRFKRARGKTRLGCLSQGERQEVRRYNKSGGGEARGAGGRTSYGCTLMRLVTPSVCSLTRRGEVGAAEG